MKTLSFTIIIIGLALTIFTTIQFFTKRKVVDIGPIEVIRDEPHSLSWSPLIGISVMGLGGVMLWQFSKKK